MFRLRVEDPHQGTVPKEGRHDLIPQKGRKLLRSLPRVCGSAAEETLAGGRNTGGPLVAGLAVDMECG